MQSFRQIHIEKIGAERLNREIGAIPMRSRHCNREQIHMMSLKRSFGKAWISDELEPGELPA